MKFLKDFKFEGKKVLVRANLDLPVNKNGKITDDARLRNALPTIKYLLKHKAKIILLGHMGRPKGRVVKRLRMDNVAKRLSKLLNKKVKKLDACIGKKVEQSIADMKSGDIILLENIRFHKEERENDKVFAKKLAGCADIYVNDAFSNSHRAHASMVSIPKYLPACAGIELENEIKNLSLKNVKKPFVVIIGGAKLETKIPVIKNLSKKANALLIGGAIVFTFFKAKKFEVGRSLLEKDKISLVKQLLKNKRIILPVDILVANKVSSKAKTKIVSANKMLTEHIGLDIGPKTIKVFKKEINKARTLVWNGPMGAFEFKNFAKGTKKIAEAIASSNAKTIVGGGDTLIIIKKLKLGKRLSFVSTGGGAMLEYLAGKPLPGIKALH
jgi:phosphoglycerate kinase